MRTALKILTGLLVGYASLVALSASLLVVVQPNRPETLTIATTDDDGATRRRMLTRLEEGGTLFVSTNHWPRDWYWAVKANPKVQVTTNGEHGNYLAVPIRDENERARLLARFPKSFAFRFITGFPRRDFVRLDPR